MFYYLIGSNRVSCIQNTHLCGYTHIVHTKYISLLYVHTIIFLPHYEVQLINKLNEQIKLEKEQNLMLFKCKRFWWTADMEEGRYVFIRMRHLKSHCLLLPLHFAIYVCSLSFLRHSKFVNCIFGFNK